jgi:hypothetical protein
LSAGELDDYRRIIAALTWTLELMTAIDSTIERNGG